ncbi:MAG: hypothetical protein R3B72_39160 [Polyangiaceae bacterium]
MRHYVLALALSGIAAAAACSPDPLPAPRVDSPRFAGSEFHASRGAARAVSPLGYSVAVDESALELRLPELRHDTTTMHTLRARSTRVGEREVTAGALRIEGERATLARPGFDEWFVNGARGVEHGYTLYEASGPEPIRIEVDFEGLAATLSSPSHAVLRDDAGRARLHYQGPRAEDATGKTLPIVFEEAGGGDLRMVIEAKGARYPITVDPTFVPATTITSSGATHQGEFGYSLDIDGDVAVAGAYFEGNGAIYVLELDGITWTETRLDPMLGGHPYFGRAVAADGDTVVGGAPNHAGGGFVGVYRKTMGWTVEASITPSQATEQFGAAVDIDGNWLAVGAPNEDAGGMNQAGAVYLYERDQSNLWQPGPRLVPDDGGPNDHFGTTVAIAGDQLIVGAPDFDFSANDEGQLYVFERSGSNWTQVDKLSAPLPIRRSAAKLGRVTDLDGNRLVATNRSSTPSSSDEIVVFERSGGTWGLVDYFVTPGFGGQDELGDGLSLVGDRLVAGAWAYMLEGRVVIYDLVLGTWQVTQLIDNPTPLVNDYFGRSVALNAEGLLLVGDPRDIQGGLETGAVYVYPLVGDPCASGDTCATGLCDDTVCCDMPCGPCGDCNVAGMEGQCQIFAEGEEVTGCSPNLCDGTTAECPACVDEMDCVAGYFCDAGTCLPLLANGETCAAAGQCMSGLCVDGVCCSSSCDAQCQACDVAGSLGTCTNVVGAPHGNRMPCSGPTCSEDVAYDDYQCAGGLTCEPQTITPCSPFVCGETSCRVDCASSSQCQEGFVCRIQTGECLSVCDGSTVTFPDGSQEDCGAYRCTAAGECYSNCTSGVQCSDGYACSPDGACIPRPEGTDSPSCAARPSRSDRRDWSWVALLVAGFMARRRRR